MIFSTMSSPPTKSAPASRASWNLSPPAITRTFFDLPSPCGRTTVPRTIWSACLGSTPSRSVISTVSSNLANLTFCRSGTASSILYGRCSTDFRAFSTFFPDFLISTSFFLVSHRGTLFRAAVVLIQNLCNNLDAHAARGSFHALDSSVNGGGVQVRQLLLGDVGDLLLGHLANLIFIGRARTLGNTSGALQQDRGRWSLGDEGERLVVEDRDHDGDDEPVELF